MLFQDNLHPVYYQATYLPVVFTLHQSGISLKYQNTYINLDIWIQVSTCKCLRVCMVSKVILYYVFILPYLYRLEPPQLKK